MLSLSRLSQYMTQDLSWQQKTGYGGDGKPIYASAVTVKGRRVGVQKLVKNLAGREVMSDTTIETTADVNPGDKIDGREVIAVTERVTRAGEVAYKGVML